jgi:hypothetical protein
MRVGSTDSRQVLPGGAWRHLEACPTRTIPFGLVGEAAPADFPDCQSSFRATTFTPSLTLSLGCTITVSPRRTPLSTSA